MWEKIKDFFFKEEEVEEIITYEDGKEQKKLEKPNKQQKPKKQEKPNRTQRQHRQPSAQRQQPIQAKMTYQYPDRNFRFPVIPDEETKRTADTQASTPAFRRRQPGERKKQQAQHRVHQSEQTEEETGDTSASTPAFRRRQPGERKKQQTQHQGRQSEQTDKKANDTSAVTPAFRRRQPEERRKQQAQQRQRQSEQTDEQPAMPRRQQRKHQNETRKPEGDRKVYKKNTDVPFQPTDVPSPVYGYHPRRLKEQPDKPAFERKQEKDDSNDSQHKPEKAEKTGGKETNTGKTANSPVVEGSSFEKTDNKRHPVDREEQSQHVPQLGQSAAVQPPEPDKEEPKLNQDSSNWQATSVIETNHEEKQVKQEASPAAETTQEAKQAEQEVAATSETVANRPEQQTRDTERPLNRNARRAHERAERKNANKQTPFNVMMTPRDKKHQFEKRRSQILDQQQTKPVSKPVSFPSYLLNDPVEKSADDQRWMEDQQALLEKTLKHFNVRAKVVQATQGPSVTRFEVQPELGVKVSKVKNLSDDLKLNMSAKDIRIEAPIPGKNTIGIEIPNPQPEMVGLQRIFDTDSFQSSTSPLTIALGLNIEGAPVVTNIQKMPHGLIAGATGSGKSVCINTMLLSLLYKASHEEVKFLLIDPKMVELAPYNGIPHLVSPVITDAKAATAALKWAVNEMEERYEKFVQESVRDVERYNQKMTQQGRGEEKLPFIVIVIDELADLMMVAPQDVEDAISRIAQKARACGIHLLVATQRPSVDVITGLIKANIPTRIAFSVSSQVDSRTIIDSSGAERLLGKGDMLFVENGAGKSVRLQGPFVSDEEIERVTSHARTIAEPNYLFEQEELLERVTADENEDELLPDAVQFVLSVNSASTSLLQRHFKIGYNRAARLIDALETRGVISGQNGSKPREVLITRTQAEEM
ncbi:DNA translocase FtsK [Lentibacillus sediminis]|uniref:DNA translocase FtsK n=1 Tax=Lentibacillus sediminis TaxID=1940529 RepID=UPI000C1BBB78|nr:DNA translocase FtsK [Lentibacillus sediminis]